MKFQLLNPIGKVSTICNCHNKVQTLVNSDDHEAGSSSRPSHIVVPDHLFKKNVKYSSKTNDEDAIIFPIKPFHNLQIRANKNKRNDIVLEDTLTNDAIAVCRIMCNGWKPYKIYTTRPNYQGQKPSKQTYTTGQGGNGTIALYTYGDITVSNSNRDKPELKLILKGNCSLIGETGECVIDKKEDRIYTIKSAGVWKRVVMINGAKVASMLSKSVTETCCGKKHNSSSTYITLSPETDPCLMVCLSAICSYIDDNTVHE
jgi:hypothetical protein